MDNTFRAVAESEMDLWDLAEQLAYDNFQSYSCENDIAEEEGYDPDITGRGMSVCKKLAQRSKNVNSAVKLYNDIMNELHEGVRI